METSWLATNNRINTHCNHHSTLQWHKHLKIPIIFIFQKFAAFSQVGKFLIILQDVSQKELRTLLIVSRKLQRNYWKFTDLPSLTSCKSTFSYVLISSLHE